MSSSKWSETHVSSSGGGGYLHQGSGHVSAPTVSSTVKSKHEFWIQTADGHQIAVQLTDADFPLMPTQLITLVSAPSAQKPDEPRWVYVRNHSAKQSWILNAPAAVISAQMHPMRPWSIGVAVGLAALGLLLGIFFLGAIGYTGYRLFKRYQDQKAILAALTEHLKNITPTLAPAAAANAA
jgi:hypothetical protein